MKKIFVPGVAAGLAMLVVTTVLGIVLGILFPSVQAEYQNIDLFRPWSDPLMSLMFAAPVVSGLILAWIWNAVKGGIKGDNGRKKWVYFGMAYWAVTIPGMVMSWGTFDISLLMVATWTVSNLAQALTGAWVLSKMNK